MTFKPFRDEGDGGGSAAIADDAQIALTETGDVTITETVEEDKAQDLKDKALTSEDIDRYFAQNPSEMQRYGIGQQASQQFQQQAKKDDEPEGPSLSQFTNEVGEIDTEGYDKAMRAYTAQVKREAVQEARREMEDEIGGTVARVAARQLADDLARENDFGDAGRKYVMDSLHGMSAKRIENLPDNTRRLLAEAAENVDRKAALRADDASPGAPRTMATSYRLNPAVENPLNWNYEQFCRSIGADPKDRKTIERHLSEGILVRR